MHSDHVLARNHPPRNPLRGRGHRCPWLRNLVPAAPPSGARCRRSRQRWQWRFFPTRKTRCWSPRPVLVAVAGAGLASGPRVGPVEPDAVPARRGGWCRAAPVPPRAAAGELWAVAGVRRAAGRPGPLRAVPTGQGESGRAGRGWARGLCWSRAARAAGFLHRVSVLQPPPQLLCVCVYWGCNGDRPSLPLVRPALVASAWLPSTRGYPPSCPEQGFFLPSRWLGCPRMRLRPG